MEYEKIAVNVADFEISYKVNLAIKECFENDYIKRTLLMVNMPGTEETITIAKRESLMDKIGLHIYIMKEKPLCSTTENAFFCKNGAFNLCINKRFLPTFEIRVKSKEKGHL